MLAPAAGERAHRMVERDRGAPLVRRRPVSPYDRAIVRLAFLAPDIQRDILAGRQTLGLNLERLRKLYIPLAWSEQRKALETKRDAYLKNIQASDVRDMVTAK